MMGLMNPIIKEDELIKTDAQIEEDTERDTGRDRERETEREGTRAREVHDAVRWPHRC